ncbi:MAG: hypothetical protein Q4C70_12520 [Planctomycetia bacterium]|nr:hypothetical protein [Planctomycetia bacterium]
MDKTPEKMAFWKCTWLPTLRYQITVMGVWVAAWAMLMAFVPMMKLDSVFLGAILIFGGSYPFFLTGFRAPMGRQFMLDFLAAMGIFALYVLGYSGFYLFGILSVFLWCALLTFRTYCILRELPIEKGAGKYFVWRTLAILFLSWILLGGCGIFLKDSEFILWLFLYLSPIFVFFVTILLLVRFQVFLNRHRTRKQNLPEIENAQETEHLLQTEPLPLRFSWWGAVKVGIASALCLVVLMFVFLAVVMMNETVIPHWISQQELVQGKIEGQFTIPESAEWVKTLHLERSWFSSYDWAVLEMTPTEFEKFQLPEEHEWKEPENWAEIESVFHDKGFWMPVFSETELRQGLEEKRIRIATGPNLSHASDCEALAVYDADGKKVRVWVHLWWRG